MNTTTRSKASIALLLGFLALVSMAAATEKADHNWPQWRGPLMTGEAPHGKPPVEFGEDENLAWKVEIPGRGSSTPIVWGDLVFLQTTIPASGPMESQQELEEWQRDGTEIYPGQAYHVADRVHRFLVIALDRESGRQVWEKAVREIQPHEGIHPTNTWASASPATDGEVLVAFFGSQGLYVLDLDGELLWTHDLGDMNTRKGWGEGASPFLYGDRVVVNWDHEGDSFIAAFDKTTGAEQWRVARDEVSSWFTPIVMKVGDREQVITGGAASTRGYDLATGDLVWEGPGLTVNSIPTPIPHGSRVYLTAGYRGNALLALDLERARGRFTEGDAVLWRYDQDTPYVPTPLLYRGALYVTKHLKGILTVVEVGTGEALYGPVRLPEIANVYASPAAAAGHVYLPSRDGAVLVLSHGSEFEVAAINELDEGFDASPAIVGDELFLRGKRHLYKFASD